MPILSNTPFDDPDEARGDPLGAVDEGEFVGSEALEGWAYTADNTLALTFSDGDQVILPSVPREVFEQLKASPSPGTFFNLYIRGRY